MKKVTTKQQLQNLLNPKEMLYIEYITQPLIPSAADNLCIALVAHLRFGTRGYFLSPFMQTVYNLTANWLDNNRKLN